MNCLNKCYISISGLFSSKLNATICEDQTDSTLLKWIYNWFFHTYFTILSSEIEICQDSNNLQMDCNRRYPPEIHFKLKCCVISFARNLSLNFQIPFKMYKEYNSESVFSLG